MKSVRLNCVGHVELRKGGGVDRGRREKRLFFSWGGGRGKEVRGKLYFKCKAVESYEHVQLPEMSSSWFATSNQIVLGLGTRKELLIVSFTACGFIKKNQPK